MTLGRGSRRGRGGTEAQAQATTSGRTPLIQALSSRSLLVLDWEFRLSWPRFRAFFLGFVSPAACLRVLVSPAAGFSLSSTACRLSRAAFAFGRLRVGGNRLLRERRVAHVEEFAPFGQFPAVVAGIPLRAKLDVNPLARAALLAPQLRRKLWLSNVRPSGSFAPANSAKVA